LDIRKYQILALSLFLFYGVTALQFQISVVQIALILITILGWQFVFDRLYKKNFNYRSALISGLSICLLVRTNESMLYIVITFVTVAGKFLVKYKGKHIFNPTVLSICLSLIILKNYVWVSLGQWDKREVLLFFVVSLGGFIIYKVRSSLVSYIFLLSYYALFLSRALYLGDPLAIFIHNLKNFSLLLFAFYMISDPKTIPKNKIAKILFALMTAAITFVLQFTFYERYALFYALFITSCIVPVLDKLLDGQTFQWSEFG